MRIAFFVNRISDERPEYTTTRLARTAASMGHDTFYLDIESFQFSPENALSGHGIRARGGDEELQGFLEAVQDDGRFEQVLFDDLDVLVLRAESEMELEDRPWAQNTSLDFGHLAKEHGVFVANDPAGLSKASSKLYLHSFPVDIRPRTLVSRDLDEVRSFVESMSCDAVVKPLRGAKGEGVFFVRAEEETNLNQILEAVLRDGYVIAQECVPRAEEGDVRVLLLDGHILEYEGRAALFARVPGEGDLRSNMSAGGHASEAELTDEIRRIVEAIGPTLRRDGMFFVGIDVIGDKLIEINSESPGGVGSASHFAEVDFSVPIIEALEKRAKNTAASVHVARSTDAGHDAA